MPDSNLKRVIAICYQMLELADHGDHERNDPGSGVVYGALRDAAYKVRRLAEKELEASRTKSRKTEKVSKTPNEGESHERKEENPGGGR
ncbi:MAG: hypothetical protein HZB23_08440 [Deltaproteobacteria bacterium]|nr:hypothetical protein [Deltaproteobacteria bacterium]